MYENRNKQAPSHQALGVRLVTSTSESPVKEEIVKALASDGNVAEFLTTINDDGLYAEVHKIKYNGTLAVLKMIGHQSQMKGLIAGANEHTQAHKNLAYEVDILEQSSGVLPELLAVVKNSQENVVGFVAEYIEGEGLETLVATGIDREDMNNLLSASVENGSRHGLFFWDIRQENFIARQGSNGIELVFVDAGGILKKDPGGRTQALGIESTLDELYGKVP